MKSHVGIVNNTTRYFFSCVLLSTSIIIIVNMSIITDRQPDSSNYPETSPIRAIRGGSRPVQSIPLQRPSESVRRFDINVNEAPKLYDYVKILRDGWLPRDVHTGTKVKRVLMVIVILFTAFVLPSLSRVWLYRDNVTILDKEYYQREYFGYELLALIILFTVVSGIFIFTRTDNPTVITSIMAIVLLFFGIGAISSQLSE